MPAPACAQVWHRHTHRRHVAQTLNPVLKTRFHTHRSKGLGIGEWRIALPVYEPGVIMSGASFYQKSPNAKVRVGVGWGLSDCLPLMRNNEQ